MNGADLLCDVLLAQGVDVCFANPGTSEMHFVGALDRKPQMRCVLGLFEGVVTGMADGYARMAGKPAATLLHTGPGLANALANIHNARRAYTPMLNVVGDHASYHLKYDAPLTSDIESLARPMSHWVKRIGGAHSIADDTSEAWAKAIAAPGVSTLILPADAAWGPVEPQAITARPRPIPPKVTQDAVQAAAKALRSGKRAMILLGGRAAQGVAVDNAWRAAQAAGARLAAETFIAKLDRGHNRPDVPRVPYFVQPALEFLREVEVVILVAARPPVSFFAYPERPGYLLPPGCEVVRLCSVGDDEAYALDALAQELGAPPLSLPPRGPHPDANPTGALTDDAVAVIASRNMPEGAIVSDELVSSAGRFFSLTAHGPQVGYLRVTGGAIGGGIPMAAGAAVASPGRKVINMQADGSAMYTVQALWTIAREELDVVTVIMSNRRYNILYHEMRAVGVNDFGRNAKRMLDIDGPAIDWPTLAKGMGVEGARAETAEQFEDLFKTATRRKGPFLIEAVF